MSEHPAAVLAALAGLLIGAVVTVLDHALSFIAVVTAVATAAVRYFAVLRGAEKHLSVATCSGPGVDTRTGPTSCQLSVGLDCA